MAVYVKSHKNDVISQSFVSYVIVIPVQGLMESTCVAVAVASIRLVARVSNWIGHGFWETSLFFSRTAEGLAWVGAEFNWYAWRLHGYADQVARRRQNQ